MANGDAQFFTDQFSDPITGLPYQGVKVYHYASGTTTLKNVWQDAGKTTPLPNPVIGDSAGRVSFYADGDYRLRVETNGGVLLYQWDGVRITSDTATMWEGDQGSVEPGATSKNQGQLFALLDGASRIQELKINDDGTGFKRIPANLGVTTKAALPASSSLTQGRLRYVTDSVRGLWLDTGSGWISLTGEVVNVREFGAKGDGIVNDDAAFQAASNAVAAGGTAGGVLLVPPGNYRLSAGFTIGSDVWIAGSGANACRLICDTATTVNGMVRNTDPTGGNARLKITDITFARTVDVPAASFNEMVYFKNCTRIWIERCQFGGPSVSLTSFNAGIHLERCSRVWIKDCFFSGIAGESIYLNRGASAFTGTTHVQGCIFELLGDYAHRCVLTNVAHTFVHGCSLISTGGGGNLGYLVEAGASPTGAAVGVLDIVVEANVVNNASILKTSFCSRLAVVGNVSMNGNIEITSALGAVDNVLISANNLRGGRIFVQQTSGTLTKVTIDGNVVEDQPSNAQFGIRTIGVQRVVISANVVRDSQGGGIGVTGGSVVVRDNFVDGCGLGGNTIPLGLNDGIYWEGNAGDTGAGYLIRNVCRANGGHGFVIKQPTSLTMVENENGSNTTGAYLFDSVNALSATPFLRVDIFDAPPGNPSTGPEGLYPAAPGSIFRSASTGKLYTKESGAGTTGWKLVTTGAP